ncbi:MAG: hypothetical protein H0U40_13820 [Chloroflexia bacterium]|nr:hypothetical protein [Chloroflexia bacterium]
MTDSEGREARYFEPEAEVEGHANRIRPSEQEEPVAEVEGHANRIRPSS